MAAKGTCMICNANKIKFISEQEGMGLLSSIFGFKSPVKNIPILNMLI